MSIAITAIYTGTDSVNQYKCEKLDAILIFCHSATIYIWFILNNANKILHLGANVNNRIEVRMDVLNFGSMDARILKWTITLFGKVVSCQRDNTTS